MRSASCGRLLHVGVDEADVTCRVPPACPRTAPIPCRSCARTSMACTAWLAACRFDDAPQKLRGAVLAAVVHEHDLDASRRPARSTRWPFCRTAGCCPPRCSRGPPASGRMLPERPVLFAACSARPCSLELPFLVGSVLPGFNCRCKSVYSLFASVRSGSATSCRELAAPFAAPLARTCCLTTVRCGSLHPLLGLLFRARFSFVLPLCYACAPPRAIRRTA